MGNISIAEAQYTLLVLRQAKLSTQKVAASLLDELRAQFDTNPARCAANARSAACRAVITLRDCLDESWPREELWREALELAAQWKVALE